MSQWAVTTRPPTSCPSKTITRKSQQLFSENLRMMNKGLIKNIHNYFCFSGNIHFFHLNKRSKFYSTSPWTSILFTVECALRCCGRMWTRTQRPDRSFKGEKPVQVPLCGEPLGHVGVVPLLEHWEGRDDESSRSWKLAAEAPPTDCEAQLPDGRRAELLGYTTTLLFLLLLLFSLNSFQCERKRLKWGGGREKGSLVLTDLARLSSCNPDSLFALHV